MNIKKITDNYILEVIKSIDSDRLLYYGIAILFVVFYHALCFGHSFIAFKIFKYGYIGVDIFLFFSGYGLCYSYGKSRLIDFYKKRAFRILPLFIVYAIFKSLALSVLGNETLSTWDWFCNITTLSYYQIGGMFIDWYLCALLLLYITFPLFRSFARQTSLKGLIVITIICYLVLMQINISWIHQCLIGRLPIFYSGILMYDLTHNNNNVDVKRIKVMLYIFLFFGFFSIFTAANKFLVSALFSPFLLLFCFCLVEKILCKKGVKCLCYIGNKSLEIYLGNCAALVLVRYMEYTALIELIYYFLITFLSSIVFIKINEILMKRY